MGEHDIHPAAGDAPAQARAHTAVRDALPPAVKACDDAVRAVTDTMLRHTKALKIARYSGSPSTEPQRDTDRWRQHVHTHLGDILADILEGIVGVIEKTEERTRTVRRNVPDEPRPPPPPPPEPTTLADLERQLEEVGGWTPDARAHVDDAEDPARAITTIIAERQSYVARRTQLDVYYVKDTGADTGAATIIRHAGRQPDDHLVRNQAPDWAIDTIESELEYSGARAQLGRGPADDALPRALSTWDAYWASRRDDVLEEVRATRAEYHQAEMRDVMARRRDDPEPEPTPEPAAGRGRGDDLGL